MGKGQTQTEHYIDLSQQVEPRFYTEHLPIVWRAAHDVTIVDIEGKEYLDFTSGIFVANIGHSRPKYVEALTSQVQRLLTCYDRMNEPRIKLAQRLVQLLPDNLKKVYLLTTGTEAVEAAVKLARYFTGKAEILSFYMSFHGRTNFTLTLGAKKTRKKGFGPYSGSVIHAPYAYCYRCPFGKTFPECEYFCVDHLDLVYDTESTDDVAALLIEPYQGAGGTIIPPPGYLKRIEQWCRKKGILLIVDEIQAGFGRTGKLFAIEHDGVQPDLLCLSKGLTSGIPGSAVVGSAEIMDAPTPGSMSTTYAGNPLAATAALAVLDILEEEGLVENSFKLGKEALESLQELKDRYDFIGDIRGKGLLIGVEIVASQSSKTPDPARTQQIVNQCFSRDVLVLGPDGFYKNVVVLAPPLMMTREQLRKGLSVLKDAIAAVSKT
ncbi:MAG: aspartate aminotransferase family protein [Candidatus Binatia bacterium]